MHRVVNREEWNAARLELGKQEDAHAQRSQEIVDLRRELPWFRVEKPYTFDTEQGRKTLAELFEGRSQLLAYNIMFGPDYEAACPGCTNVGDGLDPTLVHLNHRDVTLICFSRAPISKLSAYKKRMGWKFPYVSTYGSDFAFDFELALRPEQVAQSSEIQDMVKSPPEWLSDWAKDVGTDLQTGMSENPSWIAFAQEDGVVYQTYFRPAPNRDLVTTYFHMLLDMVPYGRGEEFRAWRKDEYPPERS